MAFGHRALHYVQHTLCYLPEPFGVALRAPARSRALRGCALQKKRGLALGLALCIVHCALCIDKEPVDYVNPLMGTMSSYELSAGNTYPAVAMPWGMNAWTPQTGKMGDGWTYTYTAHHLRGLKLTHQPSPWINDYGQLSIMPITGQPRFDQDERASWFSHKAEDARPYYYSVYLADHDVTAEVTPTERAAMMRFSFPQAAGHYVVIDPFDKGSQVTIDREQRRVTGYSTRNSGGVPEGFKLWFVIEFDQPLAYCATVSDGSIVPSCMEATASHAGAIVGFADNTRLVHARIAASFISPEQALLNLQELGSRTFDQVMSAGRDRWNDVLGRIEAQDDNADNLRTFYSCLYRALLFPRSFYEIDPQGQVVHYSPYDGQVHEGYLFTDTGFWDTFRSLFPLLNLVYPDQSQKMLAGLANAYRESGFLPEWASPGHRDCMVGNNSAAVVADAIVNGIPVSDDDAATLWQALTHGAHAVHPTVRSTGRLGWQYYDSLGYVPCDVGINESAARTLEYAYDDWCIAQVGRQLGRPESEWAPYERSAQNYRKLFDPTTRLMRGRKANGEWQAPFNPLKWGGDFTEGNAWHYTWSVFHDPQGLIELMGGNEAFCAMLDSVFALPPAFDASYYGGTVIHEIREMQIMGMGNYAHGNQPIQHMIYLYDYAGQPRKAQYWVHEVMRRLYQATPDGYCGDEDNGQTSAWYVFSALGFYPVCPGSGQYAIGSPLLRDVTLHLPGGRRVCIQASGDGPYVHSLTIDGQPHRSNFLTHRQLRTGCTLHYRLQ